MLSVAFAGLISWAIVLLCLPNFKPEVWVTAVQFSPDGKTLAVTQFDYLRSNNYGPPHLATDASQTVWLLPVADLTQQRLLQREMLRGEVAEKWPLRSMGLRKSLAFSPDGRRLAVGDLRPTISIWDVNTGKRIRRDSPGYEYSGAVAWSKSGTLVAGAEHGCVAIDNETAQPRWLTKQIMVDGVAISADGSKLATVNRESTVELWDATTGNRLRGLRRGNAGRDQSALAIRADGELIACTTSARGTNTHLHVWDADNDKGRFRRDPEWLVIMAVAISPDGNRLAASEGSNVLLLDLDGKVEKEIETDGPVSAIAFSPDGRLFATGALQGQLGLWDVASGKCVQRVVLEESVSHPSRWPLLGLTGALWVLVWGYVTYRRRVASAVESAAQVS